MKRLGLVLLCLALLAGPGPAAARAIPSYSPDSEELAFLDLINAYRQELGLRKLDLQAELGAAADYHSTDMANANYFDHVLSDGTSAEQNIRSFGYSGGTWGENIAAGMATAAEAMASWRSSPTHDAGMRNPDFREIGIGRAYNPNSQYGWYWTTTFGGGEPQTAAPVTSTSLPATTTVTTSQDGVVTTTTTVDAPATTSVQGPTTTEITTEDGVATQRFQQVPDTNADGGYVYGTESTTTTLDASGEGVTYGDINTGGTPLYVEPPSYTVGPPAAPSAPAGQDGSAAGSATATDGAGMPTGGGGAGCGSYGTWFDAQTAYEATYDPALGAALDPDADGIVCEEMMTTS